MIIALRAMLLRAALSLVIVWYPETSIATVLSSGAVTSTEPGGNKTEDVKTVQGCPTSCGNLTFTYPFGIGPECSRGPDFRLTCDDAARPPKLFLRDNITEVIESIDVGFYGDYYGPTNYIKTSLWRAIPMKSDVRVYNLTLELPGKSFTRGFAALNITGCDLSVYHVDQTGGSATKKACSTSCRDEEITEMAARHNCSGVGCCQAVVNGAGTFYLSLVHGHNKSSNITPRYNNQTSLLQDRITVTSDGAATLTWNIIDEPNCLATSRKQANYACKSKNANCLDYGMSSIDDTDLYQGYLCQCDMGYTGNPYILDGCIDDRDYNPNQTRANCIRQCGRVGVQFPFSLEKGCFARAQFHLVCTNATSSAALKLGEFQVADLNVNEGLIKYTNFDQEVGGGLFAITGERILFVGAYVSSMQFAAANLSCVEAQQNKSGYACVSINSKCVEVNSLGSYVGYRCTCSEGFEGNPYIHSGCRDIDECLQQNICNGSVCYNRIGGFNCTECPHKTRYDPAENQCIRTREQVLLEGVIIGLSGGFSILLLSFVAAVLFRSWKRNIQKQLRRSYFLKNQGLLLEQLSSENTNIFSLEELEKATNNFDSTRIIGHGGHGMVYKGILSDQRVVAIKKSKVINYSEIKQFINEVAILSQINHRNIVKLLGCCLESEVPLLVYDYISSGSLSQVLHAESRNDFSLFWDDYTRIAMETAGALSYLHSAASISIFHRDVKSSNILLDGNYTAKVSDFGASRLVPIDQTHIVTNIQGTFGYLDPEYFQTRQLNEKSDVYSFGVVLLELLFRKKPIFTNRSGLEQNLASYFLQALREKEITDIVDSQVIEEATKEEISSVASLAEMCLRLRGDERPTMKQVEMELQILRKKRVRSCQSGPENEQQRETTLLTRRGKANCQPSVTEVGERVQLEHSQRCYSLEEEVMNSASLPR